VVCAAGYRPTSLAPRLGRNERPARETPTVKRMKRGEIIEWVLILLALVAFEMQSRARTT